MKKTYAIAAALALLASCRSVTYEDVNPTIQPNQNLLPVLDVRPDQSSIRAVYNKKKDDRIADALSIFNKEVRENIIEQTGDKKGIITMRINYGNTTHNKFYQITPGLIYIPTVLGVPFDSAEQTLDIEVLIQNTHKDVIKRYTANSSDTVYAALYWGYDNKDIDRKVAAENLKKALENIRHQINNDAPEIRSKLK